jgi:hypothetical protein
LKLRGRIDELHSYIDMINTIQKEAEQDTSDDVTKFEGSDSMNPQNIASYIHSMLDTIHKTGLYHKSRLDIIKNIAPPIEEYIRFLLKELEDKRLNVNAEFKDDFINDFLKFDIKAMEKVEKLELQMQEILGLSETIDELLTTTYNSFVGMLNFIEDKK